MSAENIKKYINGTSFFRNKTEKGGISFFQALLLTLCVISLVVLLSTLVWYIVRKRALRKMRHHLVPLYHFDPGECEDWEDEILEDPKRGRAKNRPQIARRCAAITEPVIKNFLTNKYRKEVTEILKSNNNKNQSGKTF